MTNGLKILVVDDEAEARESIANMLTMKGYEVVTLATGADAAEKAKEIWPAAIILDVVLPDHSGIEVLKELRADPLTKAIPVLLLTAKPDIPLLIFINGPKVLSTVAITILWIMGVIGDIACFRIKLTQTILSAKPKYPRLSLVNSIDLITLGQGIWKFWLH